ncbi:Vignain [Platanthera zijinensis]|uniref:Vignain n=1 Tax=Platanthera zijinensis TaxID=2320716 RepID=A0AAP0ASH6_9ASPA
MQTVTCARSTRAHVAPMTFAQPRTPLYLAQLLVAEGKFLINFRVCGETSLSEHFGCDYSHFLSSVLAVRALEFDYRIRLAVFAAVNESGQTLDDELLIYEGEMTIVGGGAEGAIVVNAKADDAEGTMIVNARAGVGVTELNGCGQTVTIETLIREGRAVIVGGNAEGTTVLNGIVDVGKVERMENSSLVFIDGYQKAPANDDDSLLKAVANQSISAHIDVHCLDFQCYSTARNTWRPKLGESGYIRMLRGASNPEGLYGIAMEVSYPIIYYGDCDFFFFSQPERLSKLFFKNRSIYRLLDPSNVFLHNKSYCDTVTVNTLR